MSMYKIKHIGVFPYEPLSNFDRNCFTNIAESTKYNLDCFEKQVRSGNEVTIE